MRVITDKELQPEKTYANKIVRHISAFQLTDYRKAHWENESTNENFNWNLRKLKAICYRTP